MSRPSQPFALALALAFVACSEQPASEPAPASAPPEAAAQSAPAACPDRDPQRRVYFGDLHVHTARSMDAYSFGTRATPDDAYRFARGAALEIGARGAEGGGSRQAKLARPLDFAAVTDHSEYFGGVRLCSEGDPAVRDSALCRDYRSPFDPSTLGGMAQSVREIFRRNDLLASAELCGADGAACRGAAGEVWREMQDAAARALDPCRFTSFVAYEYSAMPGYTKVHRNVIFRNTVVPALPIHSLDEPSAAGLWRRLRAECNDAPGDCDALAIPHNSNLSNGRMFAVETSGSLEERTELARLRASLEPLVEMFQMKGDSECANGLWKVLGSDELCEFEKLRTPAPPDCEDGTGEGALAGLGCQSRLDFARYALAEGVRQESEIGVNPYKAGFIGSTDIHDGTPGRVDEWDLDANAARMRPAPGMNPGGLAAVWAEENTRESIFLALRRRETYATSGPRMAVRFFGGWSFGGGLCGDPELVRRAYAEGVPMGGDLPPQPQPGAEPSFAVWAQRDPGTPEHPGGLLQRIQIVKVWPGANGEVAQMTYDVAGTPDAPSGVDPATCEPQGPGSDTLCAEWSDPDFDPAQGAVYYARVLENPSCRYTGRICALASPEQRPKWCDDPSVPMGVQERAWTSPIWYTPGR